MDGDHPPEDARLEHVLLVPVQLLVQRVDDDGLAFAGQGEVDAELGGEDLGRQRRRQIPLDPVDVVQRAELKVELGGQRMR